MCFIKQKKNRKQIVIVFITEEQAIFEIVKKIR